jgi:hypothetical protein
MRRVENYFVFDFRFWVFLCCGRRMRVTLEQFERMGCDRIRLKVAKFGRYARSQSNRRLNP